MKQWLYYLSSGTLMTLQLLKSKQALFSSNVRVSHVCQAVRSYNSFILTHLFRRILNSGVKYVVIFDLWYQMCVRSSHFDSTGIWIQCYVILTLVLCVNHHRFLHFISFHMQQSAILSILTFCPELKHLNLGSCVMVSPLVSWTDM